MRERRVCLSRNLHRTLGRDSVVAGVPLALSRTIRTLACDAGDLMSGFPVTLINVFNVDPTRQDDLLDLLARATETSVRHAPGFISATLHRSLDGTKVTMYAQWQSREAYQALREDPAVLAHFERALAMAKFEPGMYEVVRTFLPEDGLA